MYAYKWISVRFPATCMSNFSGETLSSRFSRAPPVFPTSLYSILLASTAVGVSLEGTVECSTSRAASRRPSDMQRYLAHATHIYSCLHRVLLCIPHCIHEARCSIVCSPIIERSRYPKFGVLEALSRAGIVASMPALLWLCLSQSSTLNLLPL